MFCSSQRSTPLGVSPAAQLLMQIFSSQMSCLRALQTQEPVGLGLIHTQSQHSSQSRRALGLTQLKSQWIPLKKHWYNGNLVDESVTDHATTTMETMGDSGTTGIWDSAHSLQKVITAPSKIHRSWQWPGREQAPPVHLHRIYLNTRESGTALPRTHSSCWFKMDVEAGHC